MKKRTVLSLEQALSCSYGTLRFVQAGWRVIRLEATPAPGSQTPGDPNRYVGKLLAEPDRRSYFVAPNVGKESVALNLKEEKGRELLHRIVRELPVDVFCCNTLPKRYEALGIDFDTLRALNPNIVWAGISAYGPDHPDSPGYDPALQAKLGYMALTGDPSGPPTVCGVPVIDLKAGDELFAQVMMALVDQAEDGARARRIDISMAQAAVSWLHTSLPLVDMGAASAEVERSGNEHREFVPVNVYPTDDGFVYITVGNDAQWKRLTSLEAFADLGKPEWETNEGRRTGRREIHSLVAKVMHEMTVAEAVNLLSRTGVVVSEVNNIPGVKELPEINPKLCTVEFPAGNTVHLPPSAIMGEGAPPRAFSPPPRYGEHTRSVLEELGSTRDEIDGLMETGVVAGPGPSDANLQR
jgi:crotonobetainyl-CoA:carnitine CoA-transferase CaiB-like acyl-CoA transferase